MMRPRERPFGVGGTLRPAVLAAALSAYARLARPDAGDPLETLDVIGHRLDAQVSKPITPMTVIDADTLSRSGATTLDEILQRLPATGFQGVNGAQNSGGYGASFIDLRNLNFNRTLVLVDGRRVVLSGIQTDEAVDLANIPAALVERIEVSAAGSMPRYGADAVAGVVNIILKHDYSGATLNGSSGVSGHGDGAAQELSAAYGFDGERGNLSLSSTWLHREPIVQADRDWARDPITAATVASDGSLVLTRGIPATLAGHAVSASGSVGPTMASYDPANQSFLRGGLQRATVDLLGHYDIAGAVSAFLELGYSDRLATQQLPPQALGLSGTTRNPQGFVVPEDDAFNPYGEDVTLERVLGEAGDLGTRSDNRLLRGVAGIDGHAAPDTSWSLSLDHGESRTRFSTRNSIDLTHALQTVDGGCPVRSGCVAADYFGVDSLTADAVDYIRYANLTRSRYTETVAQAELTQSFDAFGAEPATATVGAEYRAEAGQTLPDPVVLAGDQAGGDSAATSGGYHTREAFMDLELPIMRDRPLAKSLIASASARYVGTSRFGRFPAWKFALAWAPVETLRLRGDIGVAHRIPAITEAFGGSTTSASVVGDPCDPSNGQLGNPVVAGNCRGLGLTSAFRQTSPLIPVANGGNARLRPEASTDVSVGAVVTPPALRHLSLSLDYYRFAIRDAIDSLSDADPDFIPDQCFASAQLSSSLCGQVVRATSGPSAGQIIRINAPDQNIGGIRTDGIDAGLNEQWSFGGDRLTADWKNTVLLHYRVQETPGGPYLEQAGTFPNLTTAGSLTRFKSLLTWEYRTSRWSASWSTRCIGGARVPADAGTPMGRAPTLLYHDVNAAWHLAATTLTFGIDNVTDRRPPTLIDGVTNTNTNTYDVIGRYLYLRASIHLP